MYEGKLFKSLTSFDRGSIYEITSEPFTSSDGERELVSARDIESKLECYVELDKILKSNRYAVIDAHSEMLHLFNNSSLIVRGGKDKQETIFIIENNEVYMLTAKPDGKFILSHEGKVGEKYDELGNVVINDDLKRISMLRELICSSRN